MSYLGTEKLKSINDFQFRSLHIDLVIILDLSLDTFFILLPVVVCSLSSSSWPEDIGPIMVVQICARNLLNKTSKFLTVAMFVIVGW
jgi:hypothetical protein